MIQNVGFTLVSCFSVFCFFVGVRNMTNLVAMNFVMNASTRKSRLLNNATIVLYCSL